MKFFIASYLMLQMATSFALEITENKLIELAKNSKAPNLEMIEASYLESAEALVAAEDALEPTLYGGHQYKSTNERAMVPFMPVFSNINTTQLGVKKNFKYGLSSAVSASVDERSGASAGQTYKDINTLIYNFNLSMDLWRDLFGRMTRAQLENAFLVKQNAEAQKEIEKNAFIIAVRRLYWQLVSINEKLKISRQLYEQSQKQAQDAKQRLRSNIADKSEVAKYESQVYSRKGTILVLEYQRETVVKELKNLLPSLMKEDIELGAYGVEENINSVLECTAIIASQKETPLSYTQYDEIAARLANIENNQLVIDDMGDDVDVKLSTNFFATGLGSDAVSDSRYEGSQALAQEDLTDNDRSGMEAALTFTIPLGSPGESAADVRAKYHQKRLKAEREKLGVNLQNTHKQIARSVNLLAQVVASQKQTSEALEARLREMRKKFSQARIAVSDLIMDQDAKMNSDLAVVDSRLAVVNTILDYFTIFNETPCSFNRK